MSDRSLPSLSDRFWYIALQFEEEADAAVARAVIREQGQKIGGSFTVTHAMAYGHFLVIVLAYGIPAIAIQRQFVALCKTFGAPFVEVSETVIRDIHERRLARFDKLKPISGTHYGYQGHDLEVIEHNLKENPPPRIIAGPPIIDPATGKREQPTPRAKAPTAPPGSRQKLLIERYYVACRVGYEQSEHNLFSSDDILSAGRSSFYLARDAMLTALDRAKKYILDETAIRTIEAVMPDSNKSAAIPLALLEGHRWIELGIPLDLTLRDRSGHEIAFEDVAAIWVMDPAQEKSTRSDPFLDFTGKMIAVSLIDTTGVTALGLVYWKNTQSWVLPTNYPCELNLCKCVQGSADQPSYQQPCQAHQTLINFFSNFLVTTLLAARGDFAMEEEPEPLPSVEQQAVRKERVAKGKFKERQVRHTFTRITFNITRKRSKTASGQGQQERAERAGPTWLEKAKEEGTVFYWQRLVAHPNGRTLDPEHNPRWKYARTVPVRTHPKRIPMSTKRLKNTITKLIATRDPQEES